MMLHWLGKIAGNFGRVGLQKLMDPVSAALLKVFALLSWRSWRLMFFY